MLRRIEVEHAVRGVVARHLGISRNLLGARVSLRDDLAQGDDGVHALVLAVESHLGVRLAERALDEVRSYGELVMATLEAVAARRVARERAASEIVVGRMRIESAQGRAVERTGPLTPYVLEGLCDDARRAGIGAALTVAVTPPATDVQLGSLRERLRGLARRGVTDRKSVV